MSCKDCVHFKACVGFMYSEIGTCKNIEASMEKHANDNVCDLFKNAADVVDVRHGHWKSYLSPVALNGDLYYKCSVCGANDPYQYTTRANPNYCPECGAKMDGERERKNVKKNRDYLRPMRKRNNRL